MTGDFVESNRLPSACSVFTAELYAIYRAVKHTETTNWTKIVIFSDSLSVLQAIKSFSSKCHYMFKLQKILACSNKEIVFEWVPAHVGISGNSQADEAAKSATNNTNNIRQVKIHYYDIKSLIRMLILQRRQVEWHNTHCWLQRLKPILLDWKSVYREVRKEEVILGRLHTGKTLFMIKHHISPNTPIDFCQSCNRRNNIYHLILSCPQYNGFRQGILSYLDSNNLSYSLNNILNDEFPHHLLFSYLKQINYYNKI